MLYQELYCFNCGLCSGLDTGCSIGDRLDYNPNYNLGWVSSFEKEKLAEFIEKHSAQRMEHPFFDFVEDYSMPPRVLNTTSGLAAISSQKRKKRLRTAKATGLPVLIAQERGAWTIIYFEH